jgi:hypothetical protein
MRCYYHHTCSIPSSRFEVVVLASLFRSGQVVKGAVLVVCHFLTIATHRVCGNRVNAAAPRCGMDSVPTMTLFPPTCSDRLSAVFLICLFPVTPITDGASHFRRRRLLSITLFWFPLKVELVWSKPMRELAKDFSISTSTGSTIPLRWSRPECQARHL